MANESPVFTSDRERDSEQRSLSKATKVGLSTLVLLAITIGLPASIVLEFFWGNWTFGPNAASPPPPNNWWLPYTFLAIWGGVIVVAFIFGRKTYQWSNKPTNDPPSR